jgi:hypothetical protein
MGTEKACMRAYHEMEERYAMLEIKFFSEEQSKAINSVVTKAIKYFEVSPDIIVEHDANNKNEGIYIIEFHDDYDKESGDFFEKIIKDLDIGQCSMD